MVRYNVENNVRINVRFCTNCRRVCFIEKQDTPAIGTVEVSIYVIGFGGVSGVGLFIHICVCFVRKGDRPVFLKGGFLNEKAPFPSLMKSADY